MTSFRFSWDEDEPGPPVSSFVRPWLLIQSSRLGELSSPSNAHQLAVLRALLEVKQDYSVL